MPVLVQVEANNILSALFGKAAYSAPVTPLTLALVTANGSATAAGTEVANAGGSTYTRQSLAAAMGAAASGQIANSGGAVNFTNMPACTVVGVEVWDSSGTPVRKMFAPLTTPKTVGLGDTLSFAVSTLVSTLS